jgi:predicted esterase
MELNEGHIEVRRTARYFMLGNKQMRPQKLIFVLHGYGMSAAGFLESFRGIATKHTLIVAPEGLSRFYRRGFADEVVASWMTKEDREQEIGDYVAYLDDLYLKLDPGPEVKVMVIGFSQGAATASRWIMKGNSRADALVIWGGDFAPDIASFPPQLPELYHVMASADEFIPQDKMREQSDRLRSLGFRVTDYPFQGGHEIHQPTLQRMVADFLSLI